MATIPTKPRLGRGLSSLISPVITSPEPQHVSPQVAPRQDGNALNGVSADSYVAENQSITPTSPASTPSEAISARADLPAVPCEVRIDDISPNPYQPRREFSSDELKELADSIRQQGIIQPLVVCPANGSGIATSYVLIAGERRLRASRQVGLHTVPCVIRQATPPQMLELALIENIQRADLNPVERAVAYRDYMDRFDITQQEAAERLGLPRATIANTLRILDLSNDVQQLLLQGKLTFGHAKVLAGLVHRTELQLVMAQRVANEDLSVRQLEGLIAAAQQSPTTLREPKQKQPYIRDLEDQLTATIGTKVFIHPGRAKNTGRIVIDYYSLEDFDRIAGSLGLKLQS
ncbi:MAG: ParB/RepB/Spo0J family partition protein [Phycisphaerae bacterium]|nr:ParB/RepB/Spo0J family partition protein [Phycisphaerae bacterium]